MWEREGQRKGVLTSKDHVDALGTAAPTPKDDGEHHRFGKKPGNVAVSSHISLEGPRDSATCVPIPVNTLRWEREHPQLLAGSPAKADLILRKQTARD